MANQFRVEFKGMKELRKQFRSLNTAMKRKIIGKAARKSAGVILSLALALVPVKTGVLKKSMGLRIRRPKQLEVLAEVIVKAYYAHLVEFGHGGASGSLGRSRGTGPARARPFLRPAFDSKIFAAIEIANSVVRAGLFQAISQAAQFA